jgi:hypothetical protein
MQEQCAEAEPEPTIVKEEPNTATYTQQEEESQKNSVQQQRVVELQQQSKEEESGDNYEATTNGSGNATTTVTNFGEFGRVHVVEGFALPLPDENEWIEIAPLPSQLEVVSLEDAGYPAPEEETWVPLPDENAWILAKDAEIAPLPSKLEVVSPEDAGYPAPEEETWVPFNPDDDDEEEELGQAHGSFVSEVEVVREADNSMLSGNHPKGPDQEREGEEPFLQTQPQEDNEPVDFGVPFDNDSEGPKVGMTDTPQQPHDHSMSQGSEGAVLNMSGLDEEDVEASASKKRKVVIDNENTELSNEQIKAMLADTDDIVRRKVHPAEDYDDKEEETTQESGDNYEATTTPVRVATTTKKKVAITTKPSTRPHAVFLKNPVHDVAELDEQCDDDYNTIATVDATITGVNSDEYEYEYENANDGTSLLMAGVPVDDNEETNENNEKISENENVKQ